MYCWLCPVFWVCVVYVPSAIATVLSYLSYHTYLLVRQRVKQLEVVFIAKYLIACIRSGESTIYRL